jgi:4-hydroxy-tetrahydrodipicolinate reductase
MPIKVGVLGSAGQMGSEVCKAVDADPDLDLAVGVEHGDNLEKLVAAGVEVAVDFTVPDSVKDNVRFCLDNGIHVVVGTTGLSKDDLAEIETWTGPANAFIAPNFAVGAVLMMRFSELAAPHFEGVEITERHHTKKLDAPSGTSLRTAGLIEAAGGPSDVNIHSLRLQGSVAHQEVIFGNPGETLTIRHDSLDRASFMPGVVLAVKRVADSKGLTVGLENFLDL